MDTVKDILACPPGDGRWRILPDGRHVKLGDRVILGDDVELGDDVILRDRVILDDGEQVVTSPLQVQVGPYLAYCYGSDGIAIGCERHPIAQWREHGLQIAAKHSYSPAEIEEYTRVIEFLAGDIARR